MFKRIIPLLVVLALSNTISAQTYVSVATGIDSAGCGTFNNPCGTIQYAIDSLNADSLILFAGTYRGQVRLPEDTSIVIASNSFINNNPNDVKLTSVNSNGQNLGSLFYHNGYLNGNGTTVDEIKLFGINLDSVFSRSPWITPWKDDGNVIVGDIGSINLTNVNITNVQLHSTSDHFISDGNVEFVIKNSQIAIPSSTEWNIGSMITKVFIDELKFRINNQLP